MANKVYKDAKSALEGVLQDGMMLMCGGFGLVGIPDKLIHAVRDLGAKNRASGADRRSRRSRTSARHAAGLDRAPRPRRDR